MIIDDRAAGPDLVDDDAGATPPDDPLAAGVIAGRPRTSLAPDLIGLDALDAHALARSAGMRLAVSVWETVVGPWGMVLDQQPAPGTRMRRGARLQVTVSGRPQAVVPDLRGTSREAAIEHLCWLGFVPLVTARRVSRTLPAGHIIATRPAAGTLLTEGSVIAMTVASRPARGRLTGG